MQHGLDAYTDAGIAFSTLIGALISFHFGISIEGYLGVIISFMILKSAEKQFKGLMDILIQKKLKVLTIYFENEKFNTGIEELSKLYKDLDKSLKETNV